MVSWVRRRGGLAAEHNRRISMAIELFEIQDEKMIAATKDGVAW
jgi:hypothetical protein